MDHDGKAPKTGKLYVQMTYKPMREVMDYLANEFSVYIVSGGGVEFMRPWVGRMLRRAARERDRQQREDEV